MQKRDRKGQLQLSFGMIFSIIIIIATISVAIYFTVKILSTANCTKFQLFKSDLQESIDKMWQAPFGSTVFSANLPSDITKVCIGLPSTAEAKYSQIISELDPYIQPDRNLYYYPPKNACKGSQASTKLTHIKNTFNCFDVVRGKATFKIVKDSTTESLVSIEK